MDVQKSLFPGDFTFEDRFLDDHAGKIITEPTVAIVELIANAYDAGALNVRVKWPEKSFEGFAIVDDGTGMTREQLDHRWKTFNYDRIKEQTDKVVFPPGVRGVKRTCFGQSGKGRHAPFCFSDSYLITSVCEGKQVQAEVTRRTEGKGPFSLEFIDDRPAEGHGTTIQGIVSRNHISAEQIKQLVGSKFLVDPSFNIFVNNEPVELFSLNGVETTEIDTPHGKIKVHFIDTDESSRTTKLRGIAWWAQGRIVGDPNWQRLDDQGAYLDGKRSAAKRYSFIIEADSLKTDVKSDWSGFHSTLRLQEVRQAAHGHVLDKLHSLLAYEKRERKLGAMYKSRQLLRELPDISKKTVSTFIDEVQEKCPSMSTNDLSRVVEILAKLETSRWQYDLLEELSKSSPDELDIWTMILKQWTASSAELVLGELERRINLITRMKALVNDPTADELHQLQPLFERGLWIFGTEYESVDFRSNRGLTEIIGTYLKVPGAGEVREDYQQPNVRLDFITLPNGDNIRAFSADAYQNGNVSGIRKVLIVELKKGRFELTQGEVNQAIGYAKEIKRSGRVQPETLIDVVVLGSLMESDLGMMKVQPNKIDVYPMVYDTVLRQAELRTFDLQRKLEAIAPKVIDPDVALVVERPNILRFSFEDEPSEYFDDVNG